MSVTDEEKIKWIKENLKLVGRNVEWKIIFRKRREGPAGMKKGGYRDIRVLGVRTSAHRIAWVLHYGVFPKGMLDHIDGDGMNNSMENLRETDARGNACNRKHHRSGRVPGYTIDKSRGKYMARAWKDGVKHFIGRYDTPEESIEAYNTFLEGKLSDEKN